MAWPKVEHLSEEHKRKIRNAMKGNKNCVGHKHNEESKGKMSEATKGPLNSSWKGGKKISHGYVYIWKPEHPYSDVKGYVKRARLVMEQRLGRYLEAKEIPHHKNEIKHDDRIENLSLFANNGEHISFHNHLRFQRRKNNASKKKDN